MELRILSLSFLWHQYMIIDYIATCIADDFHSPCCVYQCMTWGRMRVLSSWTQVTKQWQERIGPMDYLFTVIYWNYPILSSQSLKQVMEQGFHNNPLERNHQMLSLYARLYAHVTLPAVFAKHAVESSHWSAYAIFVAEETSSLHLWDIPIQIPSNDGCHKSVVSSQRSNNWNRKDWAARAATYDTP